MKTHNLRERILRNVDIVVESGCWIWMRALDTYGYPSMYVGDRMRIGTRVAYEVFNGPFDKSLDVCHRCDVPCCVNPDHLFLGTARKNMLDSVAKGRHVQARKTHCAHGHEFNAKNTYYYKRSRVCRVCRRIRDQTKRPAEPLRTIAAHAPEECQ